MFKVIIVDNDVKSRTALCHLFGDVESQIEVIGQTGKMKEAERLILDGDPDIVFLDIELQDGNGFELLERLGSKKFETVFTTSDESHGLEAFENGAVGYLTKPIEQADLKSVIFNISQILKATESNKSIVKNFSNNKTQRNPRIMLPVNSGLFYARINEIAIIKSTGRYASVKLMNGVEEELVFSLKKCEENLSKLGIIRIHKSFMVNVMHLKNFIRGFDSHVILDNGDRVDVGKQYRSNLMNAFECFVR